MGGILEFIVVIIFMWAALYASALVLGLHGQYLALNRKILKKVSRKLWGKYRTQLIWIIVGILVGFGICSSAHAQSLQGSRASMERQNRERAKHDYDLLYSAGSARKYIAMGLIVRVPGNKYYTLAPTVSWPYARPEVKLFIERLAREQYGACGKPLVITSLTRTHIPSNGSKRSVHPAGMAFDLRVPQTAKCRASLNSSLLILERRRVAEATRERRPPHYHVAVYPQYRRYVESRSRTGARVATAPKIYTVKRGDSLWKIARIHGTTVAELRRLNAKSSDKVRVGERLKIPARK